MQAFGYLASGLAVSRPTECMRCLVHTRGYCVERPPQLLDLILDLRSEMYVVPSFRRYPGMRMHFTGSTHTQNFSQGYFPPD